MMIIETPRLMLRELTEADLEDLKEILQDPIAMTAYEGTFSHEECLLWLDRMQDRYRRDKIGLWAVIHRETGAFLGQCGLSWQDTPRGSVLEIGYLFKRRHWGNGYATEAAEGCRDYAFHVLGSDYVTSIIRDTNIASQNVALRVGMKPDFDFIKHYRGVDMPHTVYRIEKKHRPV